MSFAVSMVPGRRGGGRVRREAEPSARKDKNGTSDGCQKFDT